MIFRFVATVFAAVTLLGPIHSVPLGPVERANASDIFFELYTRKNPYDAQVLKLGDVDALRNSSFDPTLPVKLFAHGWNADASSGYSTRDQYLQRDDLNFFSIDWSVLGTGINYPYITVYNVPIAGAHVGAFVDFLVENGASIANFHLIGFSLGGQVVGIAGSSATAGKLPRITGLDPAGPGFPLNNTDHRLDVTDAEFVDVIQTNSGDLIDNGLGYGPAIGHVDFYPNGGEFQPGCYLSHLFETYVTKFFRFWGKGGCSHGRAVSYFAESINSDVGFVATSCDSWDAYTNGSCSGNDRLLMGDPTPSTARGVYYLTTNSARPYAQGP
nr:pancreatic lipase-related protein [Diaphanosoma celebensis]